LSPALPSCARGQRLVLLPFLSGGARGRASAGTSVRESRCPGPRPPAHGPSDPDVLARFSVTLRLKINWKQNRKGPEACAGEPDAALAASRPTSSCPPPCRRWSESARPAMSAAGTSNEMTGGPIEASRPLPSPALRSLALPLLCRAWSLALLCVALRGIAVLRHCRALPCWAGKDYSTRDPA
jgi:hypothetical protein